MAALLIIAHCSESIQRAHTALTALQRPKRSRCASRPTVCKQPPTDSLPGHHPAKPSGQGGLVAARCRPPPLDARARVLVLAVFTRSIDLTRDRMLGPFAFVEEAPIAGSPADKAGLLAGDAILRFGEATRLEELPDEIKEGKAVRVTAVEAVSGRTVSRIVVPSVYDASQPHSLLGCQVVDQCPPRFMPHPAVEDDWEVTALPPPPPPPPRPAPSSTEYPQPSSTAETPMHSTRQQSMQLKECAGHAESATDGAEDGAFKDGEETAEEDMEDVDDPAGWSDAQDDDDNNDDNDDTSISGDQSSEEERRQPQSGGEESSSASSISDNRGRRVRAAQPQKSATGASASSSEQGSSKAVMACCRLALLVASAGSLVSVALLSAGPSILAADQLAMGAAAAASKYSTDRPSEILPAFKQDLWRLASVECGNSVLTQTLRSRERRTIDLDTDGLITQTNVLLPREKTAGPVASQAATLPKKRLSLSASVESLEATHEQESWRQDPTDSVLSVDSFVNTIIVAVLLQLVLCVAGLGLALLPLSAVPRLHCLLVVVYPLIAVVLWLLLAAATMYCVVFRLEAEVLVHRYWQCLDPSLSSMTLQQLEESRSERTAQLYSDVTAAAVLCASGDGFTVLGLFAVCTLIGWRRVLRTSVMLVSALSAGVGAVLLALGTKLHMDQAIGSPGDETIMGMGGAILITSLFGLNAARREQLLMLRLFATLQCICGAALLVVLGVVFFAGLEVLVSHAGGWLGRLYGGGGTDQDALSVHEFAVLLQEHRLATSTAAVLLFLLLVANASMVVALRWLIAEQRSALYNYDSVGLVDDDDDGGDDSETKQPRIKRPGRIRRKA